MIRGAIWDVDGTLLDSMPIWQEAPVRYLSSLGVAPEAGLGAALAPMSLSEGAAYLVAHYGLPHTAKEAQAKIEGLIEDFYRYEVPLLPGVAAVLDALAARGIRQVLATAGSAPLAEAALRRLGVWDRFERMFTCENFPEGKRGPGIYLAAAAYLGAQPGEILVFEDAPGPLQTAKNAGFLASEKICDFLGDCAPLHA